MRHFLSLSLILIALFANAQSGGVLSADQAAYDVLFYQLDLEFDIENKSIKGSAMSRVDVIESLDTLELDLWNTLNVDSVLVQKNNMEFESVAFAHFEKKLRIHIPGSSNPGDVVSAKVFYYGTPYQTSSAPYISGFTWRQYPLGNVKMGVACEDEGGDIWFPCKDHPSDEPDSVALNFTVPDTLDCISNGKLLGITNPTDSTATFHWYLASPINNYNITFYISDYELLEVNYWSEIGDSIPMKFWVSPSAYNILEEMIPVYREEFTFLEQTYGPFPFLTEKLGFAHSSYVGMEHQTIVAYGDDFRVNPFGYDYIHYHELAHEWWGNFITAKDWADTWIHEGMATYAEALYIEHIHDFNVLSEFMNNHRPVNNHDYPLAPRESVTAEIGLFDLNPYRRGAYVLHTLRYHLGDSVFMNLMKRWAYPDSTDLDNTNGRQCRILSTDDMLNAAEEITGEPLTNFFEVFFRETSYPFLSVKRESDYATFEWNTETNVPLDLNVPILVNGSEMTVMMENGFGELSVSSNDTLVIDPEKWILMSNPQISVGVTEEITGEGQYQISQNYPNPFDDFTKINYSIPTAQKVDISVYNSLGQKVTTVVSSIVPAGVHEVELNGANLKSGLYYYTLKAGNFRETRQFVIR